MLCALESTASKDSDERDAVELIFFPTGGGKTEAYLCLAAFSMFYRRLQDPSDAGVDVLMRYTLRLLTAQQFQRAGALICAMEHLRRRASDLGDARFTIGIWVGSAVTPNDRGERGARGAGWRLARPVPRTRSWYCDAPGVLLRWGRSNRRAAPGEMRQRQRATLRGSAPSPSCCPDQSCEFADELPILVVDQDIYEQPPSLVIGTVDKFARLAWQPEARSLFGLDATGQRTISPPNLIIQDELHLISGPLGSILGLYEALVDELCTDHRGMPAKAEDRRLDGDDPPIRAADQRSLRSNRHSPLSAPRARCRRFILRPVCP